MPTFVRKPPADLKCSGCGVTSASGAQLVECVACLRECSRGQTTAIYCSGPKGGCFNTHWQTRKHGPSGGCEAATDSVAPSPQQLRPPSAARSMRAFGNGSNGDSGSSSPAQGSLSSSPSIAAPITPPPPPRKGLAQRHYSPHAAALHAGGLRPLHVGNTQRAVSAGGPSSRD